jgi:hypothetical protein
MHREARNAPSLLHFSEAIACKSSKVLISICPVSCCSSMRYAAACAGRRSRPSRWLLRGHPKPRCCCTPL